MIYKKVQLTNDPEVYLEVFVSNTTNYKRDALLVLPGGGYQNICDNREGEPVALAFMQYGVNAFVLHYSVKEKARESKPIIEASLAMKHIKDNAEEYMINKDRVFVTGFSAGGHLCTSLGVLWHLPEIYEATGMEYGYNKPYGIIPVYPVVSSNKEFGHCSSLYNLLGNDRPEEEYEFYSLEKRVDERSVPAFIVHTADDQIVNVRNSLSLANAYAEKKIPFEMHIFKSAPHGMSVAKKHIACGCSAYVNSHNAKWVELAAEWMENL